MDDLLFTKDELTLAFYTVGNYDELCEDHFKIEKIIPIKKNKRKNCHKYNFAYFNWFYYSIYIWYLPKIGEIYLL